MIKKIQLIVISFLFFFFSQINLSYAEKVTILYTVENTPITNVAINNEIKYLLLINKELSKIKKEDMVQYATKSILKEKIKEIELNKFFLLGKNSEIVDQNLNTLIKKLNISNTDEFYNVINKIGLNIEYVKKKIEIEFLWNQLIVQLYRDKISIDEKKLKNNLKKKINDKSNLIKEYLLYEILFSPNTMDEFKRDHEKIKKSIDEIGFESSANIYSNSTTSDVGGKIGWINEGQLSEVILNYIDKLDLGDYSNPINIPSGYMILMVKDKRDVKNNLSLDEELKKSIISERNKQFNQFSSIYFKNVELNTKIYEK